MSNQDAQATAMLGNAFADHQAGNLQQAVNGYRAVLAFQSDNIYALHLLADAAARLGNIAEALDSVILAENLAPRLEGLEDNFGKIVELAVGHCAELMRAGGFAEALPHLRRLNNVLPDEPVIASQLAHVLAALGQADDAVALCSAFLKRHPAADTVLSAYARIRMPGEAYYATLKAFHSWLRPSGYLEIGVDAGVSLAFANSGTKAIGVDPAPPITAEVLPNGAQVVRMTSDDFFETCDVASAFENRSIDLAFIDGLHTFEQVIKDFMNIERHAHRKTVVLLHDVFPINAISASRDRSTNFWTGDVWKAVVFLKRERPDLTIFTLPVYPSGLCVITNLCPGSGHLREKYDALVAEGMDMHFDVVGADPIESLSVKAANWDETKSFIEKAWLQ